VFPGYRCSADESVHACVAVTPNWILSEMMMTPDTWLTIDSAEHEAGDTTTRMQYCHCAYNLVSVRTAMPALPTRETRRRRGYVRHVGYAIMVHSSETHGKRSFSICTTRKMRHARKQGFSAVGKYFWIDWGKARTPKAVPGTTTKVW
jgi:hypothetical protein